MSARIGIVSAGRSEATCLGGVGVVVGRSAVRFPSRRSFQLEPTGVVHDSVEQRVGDRRIRQVVVLGLDGQLTGDDCRAGAMSVVEDLEQVATLLLPERGEPPIVEHQDIDLREPS